MDNFKRKIRLAVETKITGTELDFFTEAFNIEQFLFSDLLIKKTSIDLLYFNGGADISPKYYNENVGKFTQFDTKRDELCFNIADIYNSVSKLGICRGAQFLTVLAGGTLIQHVEGHIGSHEIDVHFMKNDHPTQFKMTSTHHQMMFPYNLPKNNYKVLGWSTQHRSLTYLNGEDKEINLPEKFVEPEIVYYPKKYSLAIQGHPEFSTCPTATKKMCLDLIKNYLT
jgi:gamma-glutamyl-gamma-aminobutyrate hydrolase PuuD